MSSRLCPATEEAFIAQPARQRTYQGQIRGLPGARLIPLLGEPDPDTGHLGQQIGTPARDLAELGHRSSLLLLAGQRVLS
jgi:hypothetical protein